MASADARAACRPSAPRCNTTLLRRFQLVIAFAQVAEISVNKQLEGVQKLTFDDMFGYDAALRVTEDDNMELAAAVWK